MEERQGEELARCRRRLSHFLYTGIGIVYRHSNGNISSIRATAVQREQIVQSRQGHDWTRP